MKLREAQIKDLENIAALHAKSWQETYVNVLSAQFLKEDVYQNRMEVWSNRLRVPTQNQFVLIAESDDAFCGFVCVLGGNHARFGSIIDNLHVRSQSKGLGIGTQLMDAAAKWAITHYEKMPVYLEVLEDNVNAIQFYQNLGGHHVDSAFWQTPCGNSVKEFIYQWESPRALANSIAR